MVGFRVVRVELHGGLEAFDRTREVAGLEQQIARVHHRRHASRVGRQRLVDRRLGSRAIAARDRYQRPFVVGQRARGVGCGRRQRFGKARLGVGQRTAPQRPLAALERTLRRNRGEPEQAREERHASMLHVDVISLFPEMFAPVVGLSIVGRAVERGLIAVTVHDLLAAIEPGARADERPYGGGPGMVLRIEPLARILDEILAGAPPDERRRIVLTAAAGRTFGQPDAVAFAALDRLILICGHYEGVDERLATLYPLEEVSLGPFVLTGGEIAAMAFLDATVRLIDGVIAAESREAESFAAGADSIDHPAFTRPPVFRGVSVPDVLLSGDHAKIAEWRRQRSRERAAARRP